MKKIALFTAVLFGFGAAPVLAQDAAKGAKVFKKCAGCHRIGDGAKNATGPVLTTVIGRVAGTYEGFRYSKSFTALGKTGFVWDQGKIAEYISNPTAYLRKVLDDPRAKAKMRFKLKDEQARLDVVAYLASFQVDSTPQTAGATTPNLTVSLDTPGQVCVTNAEDQARFFAVEAMGGQRVAQSLAPNETLCTDGAKGGKVSVFKTSDGFEGCTRIVAADRSEIMYEYAEFDRCAWTANRD